MMQRHKVGEYERVRRVMDVVSLVEWAFRDECAQLELPSQVDAEDRPRGYGLEFVLIQRAMLATQIDGGGSSEPAHDADVVAAVVANLSEGSGGRRMAASIAEMARASMTSDWMPDATPRVVPKAWQKQLRHGRMYAATEVCGTVEYRGGPKAGGRMIRREVTWCTVTITPTAQQIAAARRFYLQWWAQCWRSRPDWPRPRARWTAMRCRMRCRRWRRGDDRPHPSHDEMLVDPARKVF